MANNSLASQNGLSSNPSIQRTFGVNPGIDDQSKKESKEKTEGLIIEAISKLIGIPATAIPIAAVAALITGFPVPVAALGIAVAAGASMYLVIENNNLILKKKISDKEREIAERKSGKKVEDPEIERTPLEIVVNIAKKPFNAAGFVIRNISGLGDPDGPGVFNKLLSFLEKRGEGDIPKEWKMILNGYSTFVNGITFPIKGALMLWGASAVIAQSVYGRVKVRNQNAEKLNTLIEKDEQDIEQEEVKNEQERILNIENELISLEQDAKNFERELNLVLEEENAAELTPLQARLFEEKSKDLIPVSTNTDVEAENEKYRNILTQDNLYYKFFVDLNHAEDPNEWQSAISERKAINNLLRDLKQTPPEITDGSFDSLSRLYFYLNGNDIVINSDQQAQLDVLLTQYLSPYGINNFADLKTHPTFLNLISKEILLLSNRVSGSSTFDEELENLDKMMDMMQLQITNPEFLSKYKDLWLAGAGVSIGGRDALLPNNTQDRVGFFRWITIPEITSVDNEIARITNLEQTFDAANLADFTTKMNVLASKQQGRIEDSLEAITFFNPAQTKDFMDLSEQIVLGLTTNPQMKIELTQAFNIFFVGNPKAIDNLKLDQVINNSSSSAELKVFLGYFKNISTNNLVIEELLKYINTDTSPLEILVITSPYFNGFYEYYGGNVSNLYYDLSLNTPQLNVFFTGVHDRLEIFINELKNLKSDLGTQSGKDRIRMDRNNYFSRVLKGEVLIEENLLSNNGRDHLQYIETLGNVLLNLNEIQNIDEILILVPDLKYANRNLITKADLSLNSAFVQKLLVVAKKVFETFISGDEQLKTSYSDIMILLSTLGLTGKLDLNDKSTVNVEFNPRALVKYLNGVKIGQPSESVDDILVKHPYGYEI